MKRKTWNKLWVFIYALVLIVPIVMSLWYVPYKIDHDEHMVETVNKRAIEYEKTNGTITDFTEAGIMSRDAQLEYEERVWELQHPELYWLKAIVFGLISSVTALMFLIGTKSPIEHFYFGDENDYWINKEERDYLIEILNNSPDTPMRRKMLEDLECFTFFEEYEIDGEKEAVKE